MNEDPPASPATPRQQRLSLAAGRIRKSLLQGAEQLAYDVSGLPMALPFGRPSLPLEAQNAQYLHDFYRRHFWRQPAGIIRGLIAAVLWPAALAFTVVQNTMRNGAAIRTRSGKSPGRQMLEQACHAWRHAVAPPWYYMFELFTENRGKRAGEYLTAHETIAGAYDLLDPPPDADRMAFTIPGASASRPRPDRVAASPAPPTIRQHRPR